MRRGYSRIAAAIVTEGPCERVVSHLALTDYQRRLPASLLLLTGVLGRSLSFGSRQWRGTGTLEC